MMKYILRHGVAKTQSFCLKAALLQFTSLRNNHYNTLEIPKTATYTEVKAAYFELSKKYHPDKHKNGNVKAKEFVKINEAYNVLSHSKSRAQYDASLSDYAQYGVRMYNAKYENPYNSPYWDERNQGRDWGSHDPFQHEERKIEKDKNMKFGFFIITLLVLYTVIHDIVTDGMMFGGNQDMIDRKLQLAATALEDMQEFKGKGDDEKSDKSTTMNPENENIEKIGK